MKKYVVLFMAALAISCSSREKKVQKLISQDMFNELYDYGSYEGISTTIDSCYSSASLDSTVRLHALRYMICNNLYREYMQVHESSLQEARGMSSYRNQYYLAQSNEALAKAEVARSMGERQADTIRALSASISKKFIGWQVRHKFRCKDEDGHYVSANVIFIMDPDFTHIQERLIGEQYDMSVKTIDSILLSDRSSSSVIVEDLP